jgi:hypothetical protein
VRRHVRYLWEDEYALDGLACAASRIRERRRAPHVSRTLAGLGLGGAADLAADFVARIDVLGDLDLDSRARRAAFSEMTDAFSVPGLRLKMEASHCTCAVRNHAIQMAGLLHDGDDLVATWHRELLLDQGVAIHHYLKVEQPYRQLGIAPRILAGGLAFYDRLGLDWITLQAALSSGRWHWAARGFDFRPGSGHDVVAFYRWAVTSMGLPIDTSTFTTATQYALAAPDVKLTMSRMGSQLASLVGPVQASRWVREQAHANGIDLDEEIPAARAIMLCGPAWEGQLSLRDPQRAAFDTYVTTALQRAHRIGSPYV